MEGLICSVGYERVNFLWAISVGYEKVNSLCGLPDHCAITWCVGAMCVKTGKPLSMCVHVLLWWGSTTVASQLVHGL